MQKKTLTAISMFLCLGTANAQVYRCGNSYSSEPCQGGHEVDVSPTLSDPRGAATREIFLCRSNSNRYYWNAEHCSVRGWSVERIARVPRDASWQAQVEIAQEDRVNAETTARTPAYAGDFTNAREPSNQRICQQLDARIKRLDSMARANSTAWITEERRLARDRQFRLGC